MYKLLPGLQEIADNKMEEYSVSPLAPGVVKDVAKRLEGRLKALEGGNKKKEYGDFGNNRGGGGGRGNRGGGGGRGGYARDGGYVRDGGHAPGGCDKVKTVKVGDVARDFSDLMIGTEMVCRGFNSKAGCRNKADDGGKQCTIATGKKALHLCAVVVGTSKGGKPRLCGKEHVPKDHT